MRRRLGAVAALLVLGLALAGCGRKPAVLEAPQGEAADTFPRIYPPP